MLLCFDCDGVILDSFDALFELACAAKVALGQGRALEKTDFTHIENLSFKALAQQIGISPELWDVYEEKIFELQRGGWQVAPFSGIDKVFEQLSHAHTIAVITASDEKLIADSLDQHGLLTFVSEVYGGNRKDALTQKALSKAERIALARGETFALYETVMIGDAISDIRQGKNAGVKTVGVTWGYQPKTLLEKEHPDWLIDVPDKLLQLFS